MDNKCNDEKKAAQTAGSRHISFTMNNQRLNAGSNTDYGWAAGGFAEYVDLPVGDHKISAVTNFRVDGNMPFSILAHASKQAVRLHDTSA